MLKRPEGSVSGWMPIHEAAYAGDVETTMRLATEVGVDLPAGPVRNDKVLSREGATPLHFAALGGHAELAAELIGLGADLRAKTAEGETPLHFGTGSIEVLTVLIDHEVDPNELDDRGETPLHHAARADHVDGARLLVRNGARVDATGQFRQTPLGIAAIRGCFDMVELLVRHGASLSAKDQHGRTALDWAEHRGNTDVADYLRSGEPDGSI